MPYLFFALDSCCLNISRHAQQHMSELVSKMHLFVQGAVQSGILMFFNVRLK
jgi:hypothetical protein